MPWWKNLQNFVPDNPYYDDGVISVGEVEINTGMGGGNGNGTASWDSWDDYLDLSNLVNLDDYRDEPVADLDFPWEWLVGAGLVLVALYASGRT